MEDPNKATLPTKYFVVEQVDLGLFDWALCEYENMMLYLKGLNAKLVFTNSKNFHDPNSEDSQNYEKNVETLHGLEEKAGGKMCIELNDKIGVYIHNKDEIKFKDNTEDKEVVVPFIRTILLDMRAEKELEPSDFENYDLFVFGGILGDHPPQDRTKELRNEGFEIRKLTKIQMSTDTAVLASKIILYDQLKLSDIPFVEEPEILKRDTKGKVQESCQMEGFTYVTAQYNPEKATFSNDPALRNEPLMHPKIKNELLFVAFDFS